MLWLIFAQVFTVVMVVPVVMYMAPMPFFDHNSVTLMLRDRTTQVATAKALATAIGTPTATLDTSNVQRFLFQDGTSVDSLVHAPPPYNQPMYSVTSLKSVILSFWSTKSPVDVAEKIAASLRADGYKTQTIVQPDSSFPTGSIVLVLSDAFQDNNGNGFGIIVRKHALRVGGESPKRFSDWGE